MTAFPNAEALRFRVYENALLVPSLSRTVYRNIDGAVLDSELRPIEASFLTRTWESGQISFAPDISGLDLAQIERVEAPHIYGGYFFDHFGHFLLESLARTWVVDEVGSMPFVWASGGPPNAWQSEILSLLGLSMPQRFPNRPILFHHLIIPEPGYRIQGMFHPRHADFLARFDAPHAETGPAKAWLSRTEALLKGRSRGEARIQEELAARGWTIVHPQQLSVPEQLRILSRAGVVAGLEGSAFHAAILLKSPGPPFLTLRRTTNQNYPAIAERKGILAFDLYGAFRIHDRTDVSLVQPQKAARIVEELAQHIARLRNDPASLEALRKRAEAEHDFESWRHRQRLRWIAHARSYVRRNRICQLLRDAVRARLS